MNNLIIEDLQNESDVEQKFIYQLLTSAHPIGLGYAPSDIWTKVDIRKISIDKGTKRSIYYPDYLVVMSGLPLLLIEVKEPNSSLDEALKEARLYATEINSSYPTGFNPCGKIIVSNGRETWFTSWDSITEVFKFTYKETDISSVPFYNFIEFASKKHC